MTTLIARRPAILPNSKIFAGIVMVLTGDLLLFDQGAGINVALFFAILAANVFFLSIWFNGRRKYLFSSLLVAILAVFALAENISWISILLAVFGISTLAVSLEHPWYGDAMGWFRSVLSFVFCAPARMLKDVKLVRKLRARYGKPSLTGGIKGWIIPFLLTGIFAFMLAMANPVMDDLISSLFQIPEGEVIPAGRLLLWLAIVLFVWPFFARRMAKAKKELSQTNMEVDDTLSFLDRVLSPQTIVRSLVMFNLLFGLQTVFDIAFLWAGAQLPDGMSYAEYAHRGAYPLLFTVLLAAIFILVTMYEGAKAENNKFIRTLVYVWIGQNVLLTLSSIERLWLYVDTYSLTYLRVAAFIWMGLVVVGLGLILIRLWRKSSNRWLVNANLLTLVTTLFVCAFINFGSHIAWFNVQHSRQVLGYGSEIDLPYLQAIGPHALPALYLLAEINVHSSPRQRKIISRAVDKLEIKIQAIARREWREMSLRDYQLAKWHRNVQKKIEIPNDQAKQ